MSSLRGKLLNTRSAGVGGGRELIHDPSRDHCAAFFRNVRLTMPLSTVFQEFVRCRGGMPLLLTLQ
jgi:hypothetical protein